MACSTDLVGVQRTWACAATHVPRCCSLPAHDVRRLFTASACPSVAECCQLVKKMTVHCQYACCSLPAWNHMFSGFSSCVRCHMVRATTVHCQCASLLFAASLVLMETVTAVLAVRCRANAHAVHCQRVFMFALLCTASAEKCLLHLSALAPAVAVLCSECRLLCTSKVHG